MNWNVKRFSMLNISQVILMRTDSNLCRKELTVHWSAPNSLIRSYLQPCTNAMWGDESEAVAPIIWLYQIVDAQKEEVVFPELLITLRSYVTLKFDGWPWKMIGHHFYTTSSFVHHFRAINEFKLELQSRNPQFRSKSAIFCPMWPRNLPDDLANNRAPLLCCFKFCASFHSHQWTGITDFV